MKKSDYLSQPTVASFLVFLKGCVNGTDGSFVHHVAGGKHKIKNLHQAFLKYEWNGKGYKENDEELINLRKGLREAKTDLQVLVAALRILEWGQVFRYSVGWLAAHAEAGDLKAVIKESKRVLSGEDDNDTELFEGNETLRSDSATTKIFSLSSELSVIYDNRTSAALARIAREFLEQRQCRGVPPSLDFMVDRSGKDKKRDPSDSIYRFQGKSTGRAHALMNLRVNWLLQEVIKSPDFRWVKDSGEGFDTNAEKLRAVEAALFMIGEDVRGVEINLKIAKSKPCPFTEDYSFCRRPVQDKVFNLAMEFQSDSFSAAQLAERAKALSIDLGREQIWRSLNNDDRYERSPSKGRYSIKDRH